MYQGNVLRKVIGWHILKYIYYKEKLGNWYFATKKTWSLIIT